MEATTLLRSVMREKFDFLALLRAVAPFLLAQWLLLVTVLLFPGLVHLGQSAADSTRAPAIPLSDQEINRRLDQMLPAPLN